MSNTRKENSKQDDKIIKKRGEREINDDRVHTSGARFGALPAHRVMEGLPEVGSLINFSDGFPIARVC